MRLTIEQVAEAMELANNGVHWQNIAAIFDTDRSTLMRYIRNAERYGFSYWTQHPEDHSETTINLPRMLPQTRPRNTLPQQ